MTKVRTGVLERLRALGRAGPRLGIAGVAVAILILIAGSILGGGPHRSSAAPIQLKDTRSSWIPGQPSLASSPAYVAVAGRADALAQQFASARSALLVHIAADKKAAQARARKVALANYRARRLAALARYHRALRANALQRARALAISRRQRARYLDALRRYHHQLIVGPGKECNLPNVRRRFQCHSGLLPHPPIPHP
jgi:hypothetical protein